MESALEELSKEFSHSDEPQTIKLNLYLTPAIDRTINPSKLISVCKHVQKNFNNNFNTNFSYNFDTITSDPPSALEFFKREAAILQENSEIDNYHEVVEEAIDLYYSKKLLQRKFLDYRLLFEDNAAKQEGLHVIIHKAEGGIGEESGGVAHMGHPYALVSNQEKELMKKIMLHEVGHCFSAKHSPLQYSFMYPWTKAYSFKPQYWDPESIKTINENLKRFTSTQ